MGHMCVTPFLCPVSTKLYGDWWLFPSLSLPSLGGDPDTTTVSGASGGSSFATQMQVVYSDDIKGAGLIIGTPFSDDESKLYVNLAQQGIDYAETFAREGLIDSLDNLRNDPIWIFSGNQDNVVPPEHQQGQLDFYDYFGANTKLVKHDVGHTIPTIFAEGLDFDTSYDTIGKMFEFVLTNLEINPTATLQPASLDYK